MGKISQFYGIRIPKKYIESIDFTHAQVPQSKPLAEFLENLFPQGEKGGEKYDLLY